MITMTNNAIENYGEKYREVELEIVHEATQYMPAHEFYAKGRPQGFHPGYDSSMNGIPLYDLRIKATGEEIPYSLYRWELTGV